jgi:hypothetical protein
MLSSVVRLSIPIEGHECEYEIFKKTLFPVRFYFKSNSATTVEPFPSSLKSRYNESVMDEITALSKIYNELESEIIKIYESDGGFTYRATLQANFSIPGFYDDWDVTLANESNDTFVIGKPQLCSCL